MFYFRGNSYKLVVLIIAIFIIPQMAFAAWWNPLSWKIFKKTDTTTQALESRVKELEKRLKEQTTPTSVVATTTPSNSTSEKKQSRNSSVKKLVTPNTVQTQQTFSTPNGAVIDINGNVIQAAPIEKAPSVDNMAVARQYYDVKKTCVGLSGDQYSDCISYSYNLPKIDENSSSAPTTQLDAEKARLDSENARLQGIIDQARNKSSLLNEINQKIAALNAKYVQDIKNVDINNAGRGVSTATSNMQKAAIERKYLIDYATLQAEYQQIQYSN